MWMLQRVEAARWHLCNKARLRARGGFLVLELQSRKSAVGWLLDRDHPAVAVFHRSVLDTLELMKQFRRQFAHST